MLYFRARSCTALQLNITSFSLNMNCGGPKYKVIAFLMNSITPRELHKSAGIAHATGHFDICSTPTIEYWFLALVRGKWPAKSMHEVWNSPLTLLGSLTSLFSRHYSSPRSFPRHVAYSATRNDVAEVDKLNWSPNARLHRPTFSRYSPAFLFGVQTTSRTLSRGTSFFMNQEVFRFLLQIGRNRNRLLLYQKVIQVMCDSLNVCFKWLILSMTINSTCRDKKSVQALLQSAR